MYSSLHLFLIVILFAPSALHNSSLFSHWYEQILNHYLNKKSRQQIKPYNTLKPHYMAKSPFYVGMDFMKM